jgi:capsular polysaccharide biosynthesis protein
MNEQIELMHHAEAVVTPHGAALTNLLFSSDAKVFELFGIPYVKPNYYYLCKCVGNEYYYMCHQAKGIQDDFVVDLDRLSGLLDAAKVH